MESCLRTIDKTMKGGMLMILIISTTITIEVRAERAKRGHSEEEQERQITCASAAPASSASLGHTFKDMPILFEHVMNLLQRDASVLEQDKQMYKRETNTANTHPPSQEHNQNRQPGILQNTRKTRSGRNAPTPENLERLLNQLERKLTEGNISKHYKREIEKMPTENGRKSGAVRRKAVNKRNVNTKTKESLSKSRKTNWIQNEKNKYKELERNDQDKRIVKRSAEDDDVGDSDKDLVKEQVSNGGTQTPPKDDDNSEQARAESGLGGVGGGQQMVMGTFQAMMMPMQGVGQAMSGLMPSG